MFCSISASLTEQCSSQEFAKCANCTQFIQRAQPWEHNKVRAFCPRRHLDTDRKAALAAHNVCVGRQMAVRGHARAALALAVLATCLASAAAQIAATPVLPAAVPGAQAVPAVPVAGAAPVTGAVPNTGAVPVTGAAPITGGVPAAGGVPVAVPVTVPGMVPAAVPGAVPTAPAVPAVPGVPSVPVAGGAPAAPGAPGAPANATDPESDYAPDNPDPLGIGGDAAQPLINPRNPLNLGGSLITGVLGSGGAVAKTLDNPNVLRAAAARAALPLVPPPVPAPPPPINVTDCANATLIDGGCPLLTPTVDTSGGAVSTQAGTLPAGAVGNPLYPLQQAPYPYPGQPQNVGVNPYPVGGQAAGQAAPGTPADQYTVRATVLGSLLLLVCPALHPVLGWFTPSSG